MKRKLRRGRVYTHTYASVEIFHCVIYIFNLNATRKLYKNRVQIFREIEIHKLLLIPSCHKYCSRNILISFPQIAIFTQLRITTLADETERIKLFVFLYRRVTTRAIYFPRNYRPPLSLPQRLLPYSINRSSALSR